MDHLINNEVDRISQLPDLILSNILSRVPFQNAISTTIISTRWKNLLPFPVTLILNDLVQHKRPRTPIHKKLIATKFESISGSGNFVHFVNKLLDITFPGKTRVRHLTLRCHKDYGDDIILSWVRSALSLGVQELILQLHLNDMMTLLRTLDGCTTLRVLHFLTRNYELCVCVPDNFSLPNLKTLYLAFVTLTDSNGKSINELIAGCVTLEDLSLWKCNLNYLGILCIRSYGLKTFTMYNCLKGSKCNLVIDAPNLKRLYYYDGSSGGNYTLSKFESLEYARINVGSSVPGVERANGLIQMVNACSDSISLCFSRATSEALQESTVPLTLPEFSNLTTLQLCSLGIGGWTLLAGLLWNAPHLKELILKEVSDFGADFESLLPTVPICLERHIKNIELGLFNRSEQDEMKLVEYFLEKGKVLEKLELHCRPIYKTMLRRLFDQPSRSKIHVSPSPGESCRPLHKFYNYMLNRFLV